MKRQQNVERLLGWTRGALVFEDMSLADIARDLERWYDVQVRIEDPALRSLRWSAELRIGESLDEILTLMQTALQSTGLRAERKGNVVTLRKGAPVNPTAVPTTARRAEAGG